MAYGDLKSDMTRLTGAFNKLVCALGKNTEKHVAVFENLEELKPLGSAIQSTSAISIASLNMNAIVCDRNRDQKE